MERLRYSREYPNCTEMLSIRTRGRVGDYKPSKESDLNDQSALYKQMGTAEYCSRSNNIGSNKILRKTRLGSQNWISKAHYPE